MNFEVIKNKMVRTYVAFRDRCVFPLLQKMAGYILRKTAMTSETTAPTEKTWKDKALNDFSIWLQGVPETLPDQTPSTMESCDLYTLLTEFIALKTEIKIQSKEQNRAIRAQEKLIDDNHEIITLYKNQLNAFEELKKSISSSNEIHIIQPFLDIRDTLVRGLDAADAAVKKRGIFKRSGKKISGVREGYEMALRKFDRALSDLGMTPIVTVGKTFDPDHMRAVGKKKITSKKDGVVLEEFRGGFLKQNQTIRLAEVIVNTAE